MGFRKNEAKKNARQTDLRKLKRIDLLEMLVEQGKEIEELRRQVETLEQQLADRTVAIDEAGDIAAACLELNHVMEAAQQAAGQYLDNVARLCRKKEQETAAKCEAMEQAAKARCAALEAGSTEAAPQ